MKKLIVLMVVIAFMGGGTTLATMGPEDKPKGCLCDIKGTFLMGKDAADCKKVGGKVVQPPAEDSAAKA